MLLEIPKIEHEGEWLVELEKILKEDTIVNMNKYSEIELTKMD